MANVIKTVLTYPLDGSTRDFNIPFEYLARKFVVVTLIGVDRKVLTLNTDYRFATRTTISLTKAWGSSDGYTSIEIRRVTSTTDRLVDFTDGSILRAYDINVAQIQTMHVAEEARDMTADTIGVNNDGHLDARGRKIVNVADATEAGDAVSFGQMQRFDGSAYNSMIAAKASETNAKASETNSAASALSSKNEADRAKTEADRTNGKADEAAASAASANESAIIATKGASTATIKASEAKDYADRLNDFVTIQDRINSVAVSQVGNPELHNSRTYAKPGTVFADGQTLSRALYPTLWAAIQARQVPVVSESIWLASPIDRGSFTEGDGLTTFRVPDYNGVTAGSIKAPAMRGDGGGVVNGGFTVGKVQGSALPNIKASIETGHSLGLFDTTGDFFKGAIYTRESRGGSIAGAGPQVYSKGFQFDANRVWSGYTDGLTEARVNANVFVWVIRTHGVVNNPGSVDAAVLASRVEQVYTELRSSVASVEQVYTELRSSVASVDPEWLPWSDPEVTSLIAWEPTISKDSNLWCRLFPTHMEIKGIIRKEFSASNRGFMYFKQFPKGYTSASAIYSPGVLSGNVATYVEGEQKTIPTTDYTLFRVASLGGKYVWVMLNMDILFR